ncbi:DNA topoisomerase-1 [Parabacteroides sp. PFB2-10]|uniref:type I DNA topoisomerase n=1 Tax=Parabacteroides sp. PFB2-10 TaxID=1742405 RepID=UPI002476605A|nr:type I DNA topoisomerase [Parabacteroides sp. PFB2-10]MDH6312194.1 DNA topoisomerase-1 [Parabacteroides sp. PFB2-10]
MNKNLVIVESPAKAKTIEKFLGKDFKVLSSYGHIRDLKAKEISIDFEHNYKPEYVIPTDKKKLVTELKNEAKKSEMVWLASDEDREGEAISWHLSEALNLDPAKTKRIVFHEITKNAILHAIETPRDINIDLVNAQQARRVLDRIVGFELSPILWKKVKPALSAGRVQSVAVRLVVEREREINAFVSEASYRVIATFILPDGTTLLKAELNKRLKDKKEVLAFLESCKEASFDIEDITRKPVKKSPAPPFTTSTLQQEAARKLGFSVSQTMTLAQRLYESGFITYMRTDSVNLSNLALGTAKEAILEEYGEKYYQFRQYNTKTKGAQEAHEAIRPTYISQTEISGTPQEKRLYELIRKRTIASQMADAELERTTITVGISNHTNERFVATGEVITFDGFLQVYLESNDEEGESEQDNGLLPAVNLKDKLQAQDIVATERFTQRPPRYTEASLVRRMEELGIGRPSTYAPTIQTVQNREYVIKGDKDGITRDYEIVSLTKGKIKETTKNEKVGFDRNKLMPTDIGTVVNDFLLEYFPDILDYNFTASVEKEFDNIADGELEWTKAIDKFYKLFHPKVDEVKAIRTEHKVGERELGIDPKSGNPVFVKIGRYGPIVQIGQANPDDKEAPKPQFASLMKGQSIETITLEEALKLFDLPRTVGEYNGKEVVAAVGRFGPFIRHDGKFVSIPKTLNPLSITLEESIALIEEKQQKEAQRFIKKFEEEPELEILNGRFGPYIAYKGKNYKIPRKGTKPEELTLEEVRQIIETADKNPKPAKRGAKKS